MQILMTGIDHGSASVEVRERFSFTQREKPEVMKAIADLPGYDGCVLLSTCNRTELWVSCAEGMQCDLPALLCSFRQLDAEAYRPYFRSRSGEEAVNYLFEVSSGLQSRIIGEDQILAQVKSARDLAREADACGSVLDVLFRSAVTGAKKVKTELSISTANASAVNYAIAQLTQQGMDFAGKSCLVIGNGEMGKRAASALLALGAKVTVTIRQYRSGIVEVVPGCERINYSERYGLIPDCDMVVSATSSPNMTITASALAEIHVKKNTVFLDLAVPRDIDPAVRDMGLALLDIDSVSVPRTAELETQLEQAKLLLEEEKTRFRNWFACRDLLPMVEQLGQSFAEEVLFRMGATLKTLAPEQREAVTSAVRDAAAKELKKTLFHIRDDAGMTVFHSSVTAMEGRRRHG